MKKTLLIVLSVILIIFLLLVGLRLRRRNRGLPGLRNLRRFSPASQTAPTASPEVSPSAFSETTTVDEDLEELDTLMEGLDPQAAFSDIPAKDLGL